MKKKFRTYEGTLPRLPREKIYLNIDYLADGAYELTLVQRGKIIRKVLFTKDP